MNHFQSKLLVFLKGLGMGAADIVPGVSGGTIAFITGIYENLLDSINSVDRKALQYLFSFKLKAFYDHVNGTFLFPLLFGIGLSISTLARLAHYMLENHPIMLWSFFFGLVLISAFSVFQKAEERNIKSVIAGIIGTVVAYVITEASPATTPDNYLFIFLSGAIAICAMILPGISGSFILLILGKYQFIMGAIKDFNIVVILVFGAGCILGLLSFARIVSWLLKKYGAITIAFLAGFMLGSLNKIWPWKQTTSFRINRKGESVPFIQENIMPQHYMEKTGNDPHIFLAILFFALGILIVVSLEKFARYKSEKGRYG
ncbi:MAG TPA: DUF368 domain-containing protein [Cytophagales bacterium]|jgi:putative membrane protein|nr:DUF368 domain-containing protein [Cytophagales bacterium]